MTIIHKSVKLFSTAIYEPSTTDFDRKPSRPKWWLTARQIDNPDRPELPWRGSVRDGEMRLSYNSFQPPRITLRTPEHYAALIDLHNVFRVRNIPLDRMLRGAVCDIVLEEWQKPDETILQLSELIFDHMQQFNINGDMVA